MHSTARTCLAALAAFATASLAAAPVHAAFCGSTFDSGTRRDVAGAGWNVPRGAAVFVVATGGPIAAVLNAVGESRTHSLLSLGAQEAAHSTMARPGQRSMHDDGFCDAPVDPGALQRPGPGAERISTQAAYVFLYGVEDTNPDPAVNSWRATSPPVHLWFQRARTLGSPDQPFDSGQWIADLGASTPGQWASGSTPADVFAPAHWIYHLYSWWPGSSPYSLYQYSNLQDVNHGAAATDRGQVCSTFMAFLQHRAYEAGFPGPLSVDAHTYSHDQTMAAGHALYAAVKNDCSAGMGFWKWLFGSALWCLDDSLCDDAAGQVRNCMAFGICDRGDVSLFDNQAGNPAFRASSISPDWLGGWVAGQEYWKFPGQSVWAWDGNHDVQWNSGGPVYACWN